MSTRYIHAGSGSQRGAAANSAGFEVDATGVLTVARGATWKGNGFTADPGYEPIPVDRVINTTAATLTLTEADHGATIIANGSAALVVTLPSTRAGLRYRLLTGTLPSSGVGTSFSPAALDQIIGNGFTPADNKDAINAVAGDVVGDFMELTGDGSLGWYVTGVKGTWTREA